MFLGSFHFKLPTLFIRPLLLLSHSNIVNGREDTGICVKLFAYSVPLTSHREVCTY